MRYVAFLRGMNLGGRRIKNEELRREFEALSFTDVACFRASGNVVFAAREADEARLQSQIEAGLAESLGYEVLVFLRGAAELQAIARHQPFDPRPVEASAGKLQVSLLRQKPKASVRREVLAMSTDADRLAIEGRELYWLPSGGMLDSALDLKAIESLIDPSTRRTKGTIDQIAAKHFGG
ncbi:MAG TPA: DUF1697 domain-containing protein [Solirubrobacterales bacterium]|nr:DUF1697 domain-containing protein [Solirubrobacterales bacterium]